MSGSTGFRCGICGASARKPFRAPEPELAPDLDMRPGEPAWATLPDWLQTCSGCGAVAPDLSVLPETARSLVESPAYRGMAGEGSEETLPFRRWGALCRTTGDSDSAAEALLMAAWAADDAVAMLEGSRLRKTVAEAWADPPDQLTALRRLDALRRSSDFAAADAWAATLASRPLDAMGQAILAFQRQRIGQRDIGRHLVSMALPTSMSHKDLPRPAFWDWLFRD